MFLLRRFSAFNILLISINGMIGSAWLFSPLYAAKIAGVGAIFSWIIGGIATILIALTFAELAALLPVAGGITRFSELTHGVLTSVIMSWVSWLSCVIMPPIEVQATLQYTATYFPSLMHLQHGVNVLTPVGFLLATIVMLLLCLLNIVSFKGLIRFNNALFVFKVFVILMTIILLMKARFCTSNFSNIHTVFSWHEFPAMLAAVASGGIAFAFTGFTHSVALAGEIKNSHFAVPFAVIGSVLCCLVLYLGLQVAFIGAIWPDALKYGWNMVSFSGDAGPFVGIAGLLGLTFLVKLLYTDAVISPLGAGLIYVTSTARIVYAMSRNRYFPAFLSRLNHQGFPVWAIALNYVLGMLLFLPLPGWQAMVSFLVSAVVISYAIGPIALLCLREQLPEEKRPFRLPFARMICLLAFYCCNLIGYWTGWKTILKLSVAIGVGFIILMIAYLRGIVDRDKFGLRSLAWLIPYLIGLILISYLGSFGGKNWIPFGWDFLIIGVFSVAILVLAVRFRQAAVKDQYNIYLVESSLANNKSG